MFTHDPLIRIKLSIAAMLISPDMTLGPVESELVPHYGEAETVRIRHSILEQDINKGCIPKKKRDGGSAKTDSG